MPDKPKLQLVGMTKLYRNGEGVRDINLEVAEAELVTLLGPSGCGKTTILRTVGGFLTADEGKIILSGQEITHL
ncbi:MAG: ATP-binding cassette domain-containing protein, partial [Spirochaetes bacterium]|nr:ATP-binding cassette domain-containing protein [Spirochaetota bacterium]